MGEQREEEEEDEEEDRIGKWRGRKRMGKRSVFD